MYQHTRSINDEELKRKFSTIVNVHGVVELPIELANEPRKLRFVGTHFFDLAVIIGSDEESS